MYAPSVRFRIGRHGMKKTKGDEGLGFARIGETVKVSGSVYRCIRDECSIGCSKCDFKGTDGCFDYSCSKDKRRDRTDVVFVRERRGL